MPARSIIIAAMLAGATAAFAEPPKAPNQQASQPSSRPVVLASAEALKSASAAAAEQAQAKRPRAARVTSCRCGDPVPQDDESEQ